MGTFSFSFSSLIKFVDPQQLADDHAGKRFIVRFALLLRNFKRSSTKLELVLDLIQFLEPYTGSNSYQEIQSCVSNLFDQILQSPGYVPQSKFPYSRENFIEIIENWDTLKQTRPAKDLFRLCGHILAIPLFSRLGSVYNEGLIDGIVHRFASGLFSHGMDFLSTMIRFARWFYEVGYQAIVDGDLNSLFMTEQSASEWVKRASQLKARSRQIYILEDLGQTAEEFFFDIEQAIDEGDRLVRFMSRDPFTKNQILRMTQELRTILFDSQAAVSASRGRDVPFSLLFYGPPKIGKSACMEQSIRAFFDLEDKRKAKEQGVDEVVRPFSMTENVYTRNPTDEYWSGYRTQDHRCCILDDIASEHVNIMKQDKKNSVSPIIQLINTVAFVTTQPDVESKGKIPFRSSLVCATTNTKDLNAGFVASEKAAILRRFPYVVMPIVKPHLRTPGEGNFTIREDCGHVDDAWDYHVQKVVQYFRKGTKQVEVRYEDILGTEDNPVSAVVYFRWLRKTIESHVTKNKTTRKAREKGPEYCEHGVFVHACETCTSSLVVYKPQGLLRLSSMLGSDKMNYIFMLERLIVKSPRAAQALLWTIRHTIGIEAYVSYRIRILWREYYAKAGIMTLAASLSLLAIYACYSYRPQGEQRDKPNFWYKPEVDGGDLTKASQTATLEQLLALLKRNTIVLEISCVGSDKEYVTSALGVGGCTVVCNAHNFVGSGPWNISAMETLSDATPKRGASLIIGNVQRKGDLAVFDLPCIQPKRDLVKFMTNRKLDMGRGLPGVLHRKEVDGTSQDVDLTRVFYLNAGYSGFDGTGYAGEYLGYCAETRTGNCGSPVVVHIRGKPILLGIHSAGARFGQRQSLALPIYSSDIMEMRRMLEEPFYAVQGNRQDTLSECGYNVSGIFPRSVLLHHSVEGSAYIWGSHDSFRASPRSSTGPTPFCSKVEHLFNLKREHGAPCMKSHLNASGDWICPKLFNVREAVKPIKVDVSLLKKVSDNYYDDICNISRFTSKLTLSEAINGVPGNDFINRVPIKTSVGPPFNKPKKHFLILTDESRCEYRLKDEILRMRDRMLSCYKRREMAYPMFMAHLKDEPRTFSKIEKGNTRVFTGCQYAFTLLVREYFLPIVSIIQENPIETECMVGTNPYSSDWGRFYNFLAKQGTDRLIAGDYSKFDKKMPAVMIRYSLEIMIKLAASCGYNDEDLEVMKCIATDLSFPTVDFFGDIVQFYGGNPSGHPLTVIVNSIVNSLYMRMAFESLGYDAKDFRDEVSLLTYGDDNVASVSENCPLFNHTKIAEYFATLGMKYTMADKEAESVPYISLEDVEILKRTFRWEPAVGKWVGPLNLDSVHKMMLCWTASKTISAEQQMAEILEAAKMSVLLHGKRVHDEYWEKLMILSEGLEEYLSENFYLEWFDHLLKLCRD